MEISVVSKLEHHAVRQSIEAVVSGLGGRGADVTGDGRRTVLAAVGAAVLSKIQQAFLVKADGGTDDTGLSWPDLKRETKAYSRRIGHGERASLLSAAGAEGRNNRIRGLMTAEEDKQWRAIYASTLARLRVRGEPNPEAKAAMVAWSVMKKKGVKTMLEVFGNRKVQILRDTGVLFNSIAAGSDSENDVTIGTNVPYARYHHHGRRPLWPHPQQWNDAWWRSILIVAQNAVIRVLTKQLGR